jgi:DsbC/DsbD-like thiol-disulfide interchange protein
MKPGWHIYALDQGPGGPVPLRISLPQQQRFVLNGDIDAPTSKTAFDPNLGIEVRFYKDDAAFILQLKNDSRNPSESSKIIVDVLYQACTQQMCMPPKVTHLSAAVSR